MCVTYVAFIAHCIIDISLVAYSWECRQQAVCNVFFFYFIVSLYTKRSKIRQKSDSADQNLSKNLYLTYVHMIVFSQPFAVRSSSDAVYPVAPKLLSHSQTASLSS